MTIPLHFESKVSGVTSGVRPLVLSKRARETEGHQRRLYCSRQCSRGRTWSHVTPPLSVPTLSVSHHDSRIANGFTAVVKSLVSDIILPPIALLPFIDRNLHEKFLVLRRGPNYPYNTLKQAAEDGAVTMAWG